MATNALGFTPEQELIRKSQDRSGQLRGLFISLITLSTIAVILRFTARKVAKTRWWWDDWLTVVALFFSVMLNVVLLLAVNYGGLGKHAEIVGVDAIIYGLKILYTAQLTYQVAMTCIKIAILLFYYRLFNVNMNFIISIWVCATVTLCWYFASSFVIIFQCKPINYLWDQAKNVGPMGIVIKGQCVPQESLWIGSSVTSLLTDVAVLCLPMPMIWSMRATGRQKLALTAVFLLGAFVCVTSIIRLSNINNLPQTDPSWSYVPAAIWTPVEASVAVISSCLPTFKPLFRSLFDLTDALPAQRKGSKEQEGSEEGAGERSNSGSSPDRNKQWRAHANAMRICELGEFRTDGQGRNFTRENGKWNSLQEEKRYGRNFSRPNWMAMAMKPSRETLGTVAPGHKRSDDTITAAPTMTTTTLRAGSKPSHDTIMSGMPEQARWASASRNEGPGWRDGIVEVREDSPHLWARDRPRYWQWRLPPFSFERQPYKTNSIISLPSPQQVDRERA